MWERRRDEKCPGPVLLMRALQLASFEIRHLLCQRTLLTHLGIQVLHWKRTTLKMVVYTNTRVPQTRSSSPLCRSGSWPRCSCGPSCLKKAGAAGAAQCKSKKHVARSCESTPTAPPEVTCPAPLPSGRKLRFSRREPQRNAIRAKS